MNDKITANGEYHIEGFSIDSGKKVFDRTYHNVVCQNFFNQLFKALENQASILDVLSFATGTGVSAAQKSDTSLENEQFRKGITQITSDSTQIKVITQLDPFESNFIIKEIGLFFSDGGIMSRASTNIDKNSSTKYNITYTLTVV